MDELPQDVINAYVAGEQGAKLARRHKVSIEQFNALLRQAGVTVRGRGKPVSFFLSADQVSSYLEGKAANRLAAELGVSLGTVKARLVQLGAYVPAPVRHHTTRVTATSKLTLVAEEAERAKALYEEGYGLHYIARELGTNTYVIRKDLAILGIKTRARGKRVGTGLSRVAEAKRKHFYTPEQIQQAIQLYEQGYGTSYICKVFLEQGIIAHAPLILRLLRANGIDTRRREEQLTPAKRALMSKARLKILEDPEEEMEWLRRQATARKKARFSRFIPTSLERKLRNYLEDQVGVETVAEVQFGKYVADLYDESTKTVFEADGDYWHSRPDAAERDARKDGILRVRFGVEVVRYTESEIESLLKSEHKSVELV